MVYKYYKSDFAILVRRKSKYTDQNGQSIVIDNSVPFEFRFFSPKDGDADDCYYASFKDGVFKNCKYIGQDLILVFVDLSQHEFKIGELMLEAEWFISDTHYEGDQKNNIVRFYDTGIVLTDKPDLDSEGVMEFVIDDGVGSQLVVSVIEQTVNRYVPNIIDAINHLPTSQAVVLEVQNHSAALSRQDRRITSLEEKLNTLTGPISVEQSDSLSSIL